MRILAIHPPHLVPEQINFLTNQYSLHSIRVEDCLQKLSSKKNFNEFVEKHIRRNGYISKEVELAILETECRSSAARNKGYLISGWPKRKESLSFLKESFLNPHIIFIFDLDEKSAEEQFEKVDSNNHRLFAGKSIDIQFLKNPPVKSTKKN